MAFSRKPAGCALQKLQYLLASAVEGSLYAPSELTNVVLLLPLGSGVGLVEAGLTLGMFKRRPVLYVRGWQAQLENFRHQSSSHQRTSKLTVAHCSFFSGSAATIPSHLRIVLSSNTMLRLTKIAAKFSRNDGRSHHTFEIETLPRGAVCCPLGGEVRCWKAQ